MNGTQRATDSPADRPVKRVSVAKADLELRRVHVDVDPLGGDFEKQHRRRIPATRDQRRVRRHQRVLQQSIAHQAAVDEEQDRTRIGEREVGMGDEA